MIKIYNILNGCFASNKAVLTTTEKGKLDVFQNPGYSECLDLVVFGVNLYSTVLIIRYELNCTLRLKRKNQYRIYIRAKSLAKLRKIVYPYMDSSMLYKL